MGPIPPRPAQSASQFASVPIPSGDTRPTPVTTTRLLKGPPSEWSLLFAVRLDVLDRFLHARDLLGVLVRNLDAELLLERHHQLHRVERVRPEVVHERGVRGHFFFVDAQLLHDDALDFVCDGHSVLHGGSGDPRAFPGPATRLHMYIPPFTASTCPVIYDASSEARKHTAAATSSGVPSRRSGIRAAQSSSARSVMARVMSVSIIPGATTLIVIPREATSSAAAFAKPISPAFDA